MQKANLLMAIVVVILAAVMAILAGAALAQDAEDTYLLQERLNSCGYSVPVTGHYGEQTEAAIRRFQADRDMLVDGVAGPDTRTMLFACREKERVIIEGPAQLPVETYVPEPDRSEGPRCLDQVVKVKGPIGFKIGGFAERSAIVAWKTQVGDKFGTQYVEWENAKDKVIDCDPACSKCTARVECSIEGRPCRD